MLPIDNKNGSYVIANEHSDSNFNEFEFNEMHKGMAFNHSLTRLERITFIMFISTLCTTCKKVGLLI